MIDKNNELGKFKDALNEANKNIGLLKIKLADMYLKTDATQTELVNQINALRLMLSDAFNIVGLENPSIEEFKLKLTKLVNESKIHVADKITNPPEEEIVETKKKIHAEGKKKPKQKNNS